VESSRPVLVKEDPLPAFALLPAVPDPRADLLKAAGAKIRSWEGVRRLVYTDPSGNKAVGIGCNLDTSSAPALLKAVGANYSRVRGGLDRLSTRQVEKLFQTQLDLALDVVEGRIGQTLYTLPSAVQILLLDLSFNCGKAGSGRFRSVSRAATGGRYDRLPSLLKATRWYRQTGVRAKEHIEALAPLVLGSKK
jgi:GH24 family phage-related lysozyme (muramidase)